MRPRVRLWTLARAGDALLVLGAAAMVLAPVVGAVVIAIAAGLRRAARLEVGWTGLWLAFLVPPVAVLLASGHLSESTAVVLQALLGIVAASVLRGRRGPIVAGLALGLVVAALAMGLGQVERGRLFATHIDDDTALQAVRHVLGRGEVVSGRRSRAWRVDGAGGPLTLSLAARKASGSSAWAWRLHGRGEVRPAGRGSSSALLRFGEGGDPYAQRIVRLGSSAAGRTFRLRLELRSPQPLPAQGCRGVWLQVWGPGGGSACRAVALGPEWRPVELVWTVPEGATSDVLRVILNDFDGASIEARRMTLEERRAGAWVPTPPAVPSAARLALRWRNGGRVHEVSTVFDPSGAWRDVRLRAPANGAAQVRAVLWVGGGARLAVRDVRLVDATGSPVGAPVKPELRQSLGAEHPNFTGHALAVVGVVAVLLSERALATGLAFAAALAGLWFTGSRTALATGAASMALVVALRVRRRKRLVRVALGGMLALVAAAVGASLAGVPAASALPFNLGQETPRREIWGTALQAFLTHPLRGLAGSGTDFPSYWLQQHPQATEARVAHAHDLWLQFAASYGVAGVVTVLVLTGGLAWLGWRRARLRGLALVGTTLALNVFDLTLFYAGVFMPLLLGLNLLRPQPAARAVRAGAGAAADARGPVDGGAPTSRAGVRGAPAGAGALRPNPATPDLEEAHR